MRVAFPIAVLLALAACGRPDPVANDADNAAALPAPLGNTAASPTGGPPKNRVQPVTAEDMTGPAIPAALQGRWGLTPVDCTSTRGDAKGLLLVSATDLRFYESRAVPSPGVETSPDSVSGNFSFNGEGQSWTKHESLQLRDGKLVRTERHPNASFSYVRC